MVVLTTSAIVAPADASTAARLRRAWSVWASMPSGAAPVAGSMPAVPEQNTKPPATIAWLYGPTPQELVGGHCLSVDHHCSRVWTAFILARETDPGTN